MQTKRLAILSAAAAFIVSSGAGSAADLLGLYIGGSIGQGYLEAAETVPPPPVHGLILYSYDSVFSAHATAFKVFAGIRPLSFFGAEVAYDDFGHATGNYNNSNVALIGAANPQIAQTAHVSMKGGSAFGVLYLPVAHFDLFAKAGLADVRSSLITNNLSNSDCGPVLLCARLLPVDVDRTNLDFAAGAGAQIKLTHFALRAEYERFTAAGAHPELLSLGVIWSL